MTKFAVCLLALCGTLIAQPKIACDEPVWNFGTVPQHNVYKHDYIVKNVGDAPLTLKNVIPSCQCAAALPDKKLLQPGEQAKISAEFKSLTFKGRVVKTITVVSDDPNKPHLQLQIKGDVITPVSVRPAQLSFGEIPKTETSEAKEFTVLVTRDIEFDPKQVVPSSDLIEIEPVGEMTELDNGTRSQKFSARKKPGGRVGLMSEKIVVKTSLPGAPAQLGISCNVLGELKLNPRTFNLGRVKEGEGAMRELELTKLGDKNLRVEEVRCVPDVFKATVEEVEAGGKYKVRVELKKDAAPRYYRGTVSIITNVEGENMLTAYFYAFVSR